MSRFLTFPLIVLTAAVCGCSSLTGTFDAYNPFQKKYVTADEKNPAVEVACIWQPGEGRNGQGLPSRGFAGQIYFFTRGDAEPVIVDGEVRVYLFADRGIPEEDGKPLHQYDYAPEAWAAHATMTSLGPSYSVFIPYPGKEAHQVRCQLRARFTPKTGGPPIWSEAITMTLDGPPRPGQEPSSWSTPEAKQLLNTKNKIDVSQRSGTPAQLAGRQQPTAGPVRQLRTDTIPLGVLQQVAYEVPARTAAKAPSEPVEPVARNRNSVPLEQALAGLSLNESDAPQSNSASHPLLAALNPSAQQPHPLSAASTPQESRSPLPADHPLGRVTPLAEGIPVRQNGMRPAYPNLSSRRLTSQGSRPRHSLARRDVAPVNTASETTEPYYPSSPAVNDFTQQSTPLLRDQTSPQSTAEQTLGVWESLEQ